MSSSPISKEVFLRDADDILRQKGLLEPIRDLFPELAPIQGSSATDKETQIKAVLQREGWTHTSTAVANYNRPQFDGIQDGVAFDHEAREQMNVRSHLLFIEAAFREGKIDAGVMTIPSGEDAKVRRIEKEATGEGRLFTYHFPLFTPLYLIEYHPD